MRSKELIFEYAIFMMIGVFSLCVKYVTDVVRGAPFRLMMFVAYGFIGSFLGYLCNSFLPHDWDFRGGLTGLICFLGFQVISLIEKKGLGTILNALLKMKIELPREDLQKEIETVSDANLKELKSEHKS